MSELALHPRTVTASQPKTAVAFRVPAGACDCHVHVFGTAAEFPFAAQRGYTPPPAGADELSGLQQALRLSRVVIVQPSVYGSDNLRSTACGSASAPGVAVIDECDDEALDEMHRPASAACGSTSKPPARPIRMRHAAISPPRSAGRTARLACPGSPGCRSSPRSARKLQAAGADRFDHFGDACGRRCRPARLAALPQLVGAGHAYVKVSAAYRSSEKAPAYGDVAPLAKALIAANPERIWGTIGRTRMPLAR
jgi:predicted TIM-barrel fold metal-dependent hydrolase